MGKKKKKIFLWESQYNKTGQHISHSSKLQTASLQGVTNMIITSNFKQEILEMLTCSLCDSILLK